MGVGLAKCQCTLRSKMQRCVAMGIPQQAIIRWGRLHHFTEVSKKENEMHGFRRGNEIIHITHLPAHKKPVLLIGNDNCCQKIASFNSEEDAEAFCKLLDDWLEIKENE